MDLCEFIWTAANGAAVALTPVATTAKEGGFCMKITAPAVPAANTLYAYHTMGLTDFHTMQKLSLWVRSEVAIALNNWKICLCSDVNGAVPVDTFLIQAIPSVNYWAPLTMARVGGGNCGAAIQSVALYSGTAAPTASKYVYLDDIITCLTDGLNLQSLISRNTLEQGGAEGWYGIKYIDARPVGIYPGGQLRFDNQVNNRANSGQGYFSIDTTVAPYSGIAPWYKRETIKTDMVSAIATVVQECQDNGTVGNNIQFQGGYDTSTGLQTGETHFDALNGMGYGLQISSKSYNTINLLSFHRYDIGVYFIGATYNLIDTIHDTNNCSEHGIKFDTASNYNTINTLFNANNNSSHGLFLVTSTNNIFNTIGNINNNYWFGLRFEPNASNNYFGTIFSISNDWGNIYINSGSCRNTIVSLTYCYYSQYSGIAIYNSSHANYIGTIDSIVSSDRGGAGYCNLDIYNSFANNINYIGHCNWCNTWGIRIQNSCFNHIGEVGEMYRNNWTPVQFLLSYFNKIDSLTSITGNGAPTSFAVDFNYGGANPSGGNIVGVLNVVAAINTSAVYSNLGENYVLKGTVYGGLTKVTGATAYTNSRLYFHDLPSGLDEIYTDYGYLCSQTAVRHTASGIAWRLDPTSVERSQYYPLTLSIAKIAVNANKLVTVKAWFKKSHATDIVGKLVCRGLQLAGVPADVVAVKADDTNWEELTITFTPTEQGVIEIEAWAYWVANLADESVYVDDMTITQAS